jgi:hypothetical protein
MTTIISFYTSPDQGVFLQYAHDVTCELLAEFRNEVPRHTTFTAELPNGCDAEIALAQVAKYLWKKLGDVPVDDDGKLEDPFLHFTPGTDREDIWSWFEEELDASVHALMFPSGKTD